MAKHSFRDRMEGKVCTKCGEWKPLDEFYVHKRTGDGFTSHCRECVKAWHRDRRKECPGCGKQIYCRSRLCKECKLLEKLRDRHKIRDGIEGKVCTECKEWRPLSGFCKHNQTYDRLSCWCKQCMKRRRDSKRGSCELCGATIHFASALCISCSQIKRWQRGCGYVIRNGVKGKTCTCCGVWKSLSEFHKMSSLIITGVRAICKRCHKAYNRAYRQEHREERREYDRQWAAKNPDRVRLHSRLTQHRRRARLAKVLVEDVDEKTIYERCNYRCVYCGRTEDLTLDHVIPIAKSGAHIEDNLVIACRRCNSEKHTKLLGIGEDCWLPWEWHGPFPYEEIQLQVAAS